jgi:hypothetical protein
LVYFIFLFWIHTKKGAREMKAFPSLEWISSDNKKSGEGMDLRDYFAAKAMQGIQISASSTSYENIAKHAYVLADAMMKAREQ